MNRLLYPDAAAHSASGRTRSGLVAFAVALVWLGGIAWMRPLFLPDEGRYVGVAWEMLSSGNWLTPTLDGMPFFHKPPLFYWLTALAMNAFGPNVQHIQRFASTGFNNVEPLWFYVPVLFVLALPWSAWLLVHLRGSKLADDSHRGVLSLMCIWLGVVVCFFSVPQSKPVGYIVPALWPAAVLVACTASSMQASGTARNVWWGCGAVAVCACVGVSVVFALVHPKSSRELALQLEKRGDGQAAVWRFSTTTSTTLRSIFMRGPRSWSCRTGTRSRFSAMTTGARNSRMPDRSRRRWRARG